ncbi:hypothetical protein LCGC14_0719990 [marine sediment metagenome]|uniref:Uncharacterized protein n=1 Tax=marine sediment metagenome TaxID=412755 RepID=A0A0F9TK25_9ZZZZ
MNKIICWLFGHKWFVCWPDEIRYQEGMETFRQKSCIRCPKTVRFDIQRAKSPLPPIDCNQEFKWVNYYMEYQKASGKKSNK